MRSRLLKFIGVALFAGALLSLPIFLPPLGAERGGLPTFIGRFHPLALHLPIAFFLLLPGFELLGGFARWSYLRATAGWVLVLAAGSATVATLLGWLLARSGGYEGELVRQHLWGGVILSIAGVVACAIRRPGGGGALYHVLLFAIVAVMGWTSHLGGQLTHGATYLTQHMPPTLRSWLRMPAPPARAAAAAGAEATLYAARIQPIFDQSCVTCHNENKVKGDLRMDDFAQLVRGGKSGPAFVAGDPATSELYRRITLPHGDDKFMPAEGKRPLDADQVRVIEQWIKLGADDTLPLSRAGAAGEPAALAVGVVVEPLAPDYRPHLAELHRLEASLGVRLVPRSRDAGDGLILRTVSAPARCDDAALRVLAPVARFIVDAELARSAVTDAGLAELAAWPSLRRLDLTATKTTPAALPALVAIPRLAFLNLSDTAAATPAMIVALRARSGLEKLYAHPLAEAAKVVAESAPPLSPSGG